MKDIIIFFCCVAISIIAHFCGDKVGYFNFIVLFLLLQIYFQENKVKI